MKKGESLVKKRNDESSVLLDLAVTAANRMIDITNRHGSGARVNVRHKKGGYVTVTITLPTVKRK